MKKLGVLAAVVAVLALPATTLALVIPGTLDQHQDSGPDGQQWGSAYILAQTFTAGLTGSLDAATVSLAAVEEINKAGVVQPQAIGDLEVAIYATSVGLPTGVSLAHEDFTGVTGATTLVAEFSTPTQVTAGTQYALVLQPGTGGLVNWLGVCDSNPYAGGQALVFDVNNNPSWLTLPDWAVAADSSACINDFEFSTYVTVPQATAQPTVAVTPQPTVAVTPPPTGTGTLPGSRTDSAPLLVAVGLALAAAFVTIRRYGLVRR
jgi:hypothetical protein